MGVTYSTTSRGELAAFIGCTAKVRCVHAAGNRSVDQGRRSFPLSGISSRSGLSEFTPHRSPPVSPCRPRSVGRNRQGTRVW